MWKVVYRKFSKDIIKLKTERIEFQGQSQEQRQVQVEVLGLGSVGGKKKWQPHYGLYQKEQIRSWESTSAI